MALCSPIFSTSLGRKPQGHSSGVTVVTLLLESLRATFKFSQELVNKKPARQNPRQRLLQIALSFVPLGVQRGGQGQQGGWPPEEWTDAYLSGAAWSKLWSRTPGLPGLTWHILKEGRPLLAPPRTTGAPTTKKMPTWTKEAAAFVLPPSFSSCASGTRRTGSK